MRRYCRARGERIGTKARRCHYCGKFARFPFYYVGLTLPAGLALVVYYVAPRMAF